MNIPHIFAGCFFVPIWQLIAFGKFFEDIVSV